MGELTRHISTDPTVRHKHGDLPQLLPHQLNQQGNPGLAKSPITL
ncbi:hypothetical protein F4561_005195 [Lipingzhangella halophila]|uniref:Uncharacterized protein n=1 Tax=Lipingzhangella halophila TaxID=1783352 RepID=A0A7W7RLV4_9ACTN|nr:hypothetical protein [Lipingzhangella halophila]MBB4934375.1 hypothetical protein [Lipingzhangella halophila]